jgi:hypothetical protein
MIYFRLVEFWTDARWSSPRPQYVANLKMTFIAVLKTILIFGRIEAVDDSSISRVVEILQPFAKPTVLLDYSLEVR